MAFPRLVLGGLPTLKYVPPSCTRSPTRAATRPQESSTAILPRSVAAWHRTEPVREVVNRWRVDDDWGRVPISRTYYTVATPTAPDDRAGDRYPQRVKD